MTTVLTTLLIKSSRFTPCLRMYCKSKFLGISSWLLLLVWMKRKILIRKRMRGCTVPRWEEPPLYRYCQTERLALHRKAHLLSYSWVISIIFLTIIILYTKTIDYWTLQLGKIDSQYETFYETNTQRASGKNENTTTNDST